MDIRSTAGGENIRLSPELGNVCFASSQTGWCFSLKSFAQLYSDSYEAEFDTEQFAKRLWGEIFFNPEKGSFHRSSQGRDSKRTFVHFILEPLYKLYSQVNIQIHDLGGVILIVGVYM